MRLDSLLPISNSCSLNRQSLLYRKDETCSDRHGWHGNKPGCVRKGSGSKMLDIAVELVSPYAQAIKDDETGSVAEQVVESLLDDVDDDMADFLYENWEEILKRS